MKVAILESILTPGGHEVEFDRILNDELKRQGHDTVFFVPLRFNFKVQYDSSISYLSGGEAVSYEGVGRLKRLYLSLLREKRRIAWFNSAHEKANAGECDAIIIPTTTWRGLRSLRNSKLRESTVPVLVIIHGVNPGEYPKFKKQVLLLKQYKNIHICVIGLQKKFEELQNLDTFSTLLPPVFKPVYAHEESVPASRQVLKLGFFGQFRREKNVEVLLKAFSELQFNRPVELIVQGSTVKPEDANEFERLIKKYGCHENITFIHKGLIGKEWEDALLGVDVLLMPYGAERYKYHWSAMLFTALGFNKPVLQSKEINPEVMQVFRVGHIVNIDDLTLFKQQIHEFVDGYDENKMLYNTELEKANKYYSHSNLIKNMMNIMFSSK